MTAILYHLLHWASIFIFVTVCIGVYSPSIAQELPPVSKYSTEVYGADNQNWSITQTKDRLMFFANSQGLLRYDGEKWDLYSSPNKTILRSVFADGNKVYSGAYMDFGVWELNQNHQYTYTSLSKDLKLLEDEQFWKITKLDQYVVFQSLNSIYLYDVKTKNFDVISSTYGIHKMMKINNILYYHKINEGIFKLVNGVEVPVNTSAFIRNSLVVNMYKIDNELYVQTQFNGIVNLRDNTPYSPSNFIDIWPNVSVYNSLQSANGDIYLGTISHGLLKLSKQQIEYQLNQENTLSNNTVLSLFEDVDGTIWLGLDNGINSVNTASSIRIYNDYNGDLGTVYASIHFNGRIYLGTNQGLFYRDIDSDNFNFIKGTKGQVWTLFQFNNQLFCGHNLGTFLVEDKTAKLISDINGTWLFKAVDEQTIVSGNYNGLHVYVKEDSEWKFRNKIEGFNISTKYFEFVNKNKILVNHEYKGIFELQLNDSLTKVTDVKQNISVPNGLFSSMVKSHDKILYAYQNGIFEYDSEANQFVKDTVISKIYENDEYTSGRLVKTDDGKLWAFSKTDITILSPSSLKNKYVIDNIPINQDSRQQISGYENLSLVAPNTYIFGSSNGYFKLQLNNFKNPEPTVYIKDIFVKSKNDDAIQSVGFQQNNTFEDTNNNLDFHFTTYNYNSLFKSEYQFRLKNYSNWSDWAPKNKASFKNLTYGDYTFEVRSRIGKDNVSELASYHFTINRPFYLTNKMIGLYIVLLIIVILIIHFFYKQYYKQQKRKLREEANRELELKELEAQRKIMRLSNDKLKQDIENKNRELAISTMSLVKKNEFLARIKSDLKQVKVNDQKLDNVLKTINKNLNNSDDWSFFEEAFNNADKDFLKKIKSKHPALTPNDLRLCAYLRLNLTSKEIAPLFNISTRSVEVKRYRLRKKMDLPRDASLTNYILEI